MPISYEKPMEDAPTTLHADGNQYCFVPDENGSFSARSKNNTFDGVLDASIGDTEDWIIIELKAGTTYKFNLDGRHTMDTDDDGTNDAGAATDTILKILDSKGNAFLMNDDAKGGADGNLFSEITFAPEEDGIYYLSVTAYSGNPTVDHRGGYRITVTELDLPGDIVGTRMSDKLTGTDGGESINGRDGDDVIYAVGGNDMLMGGPGKDLLDGGPGRDSLSGGADEDTITYIHSSEGVTINLLTGTARGGDAEGDTIGGARGDDIENVQGSMHDDRLTGDDENNKLWGLGGDDELNGGEGVDTLSGGDGNDMLNGGDDNDMLEGGAGADDLIGGGRKTENTAMYSTSSASVMVRLHSSQAMGGDAEGDKFGRKVTVEYTLPPEDEGDDPRELEESVPDIMHLIGSDHADILAGDSRANDIWGGGGNDKLYGGPGGGDDELYGQGGNDMAFGGLGNDTLHGGDGDDTLNGGPGDDTYYGGAGSDTINADIGDLLVAGGVALDDATTTEVDERMEMMGDVDTVSYARSEKGVNKNLSTVTADRTDTELGNDTAFDSIENIIGTGVDDTLTGNAVDNVIEGGDGADILDGGDETAAAQGGRGDTLSYANSDQRVSVNLATNSAFGGHAAGDNIAATDAAGNNSFENIIGSDHDDILTGDGANNRLYGGVGEDELDGGGGSDTIEGGAGMDELDGGNADEANIGTGNDTDNDTLSYSHSNAGVIVNLATSKVSGGHADGDEIAVNRNVFNHDGDTETEPVDVSTFESATGSAHNDRLSGDHRANTLSGLAGNDILRGGAGSDTLIGGPGADDMDGGHDPDDEDVADTAMDTVSYMGAMAGVTVDLNAGRGTGGDAEGDTYSNIEDYEGSDNDDTFIAGEFADNVNAMGNPDMEPKGDTISYELSEAGVNVTLETQDGTAQADADNPEGSYARGDILQGFENITGSDHDDILTGLSGASSTLKGGGGTDDLNGGSEDDMLMGDAGDDDLSGGDGDDTLVGGSGNDTLAGGDAGDKLTGGAGDDVMNGDAGEDTFIFGPGDGDGDDVIVNLSATEDKIDLSAFGISAAQLTASADIFNGNVRIDLTEFGGGKIILQGTTNFNELDTDTSTDADDNEMLDFSMDADTGVVDTGVFIL